MTTEPVFKAPTSTVTEVERLRRARDFWFSAAKRALRELEAVADDARNPCLICEKIGPCEHDDPKPCGIDTMIAYHDAGSNDLPHDLRFVPLQIEPIQHNVNSGIGKTTETMWKVIGRDDLNRENVSDYVYDENMTESAAKDLVAVLNQHHETWHYVAVPMSHKLYTWEP